MKTQALKGMRDLLPAEQTLRDYIQGKILDYLKHLKLYLLLVLYHTLIFYDLSHKFLIGTYSNILNH